MAPKYWPLARGHMVTDTFGWRAWRAGTHWGMDFGREGGSGGLPVFAVQGGTVVNLGPASGFGQWIVLDHPTDDGGGTTVYGHIIPEVRLGQRVEAGQRIAHINPDPTTNGGTSQRPMAPHLHLEWHRAVWSPTGPDRLDPLPLLAGALFPGETPSPAPAAQGYSDYVREGFAQLVPPKGNR
ncbi:M23 family metallopeptidase [Rhodococcus pyridinivorans]|uniref:M23 family metallopeptidase n=1 Tax=Rhodococcus pyridinivorans TaxID=103816 RepID=UPI001E37FA1F|nr:M23 family metallopeptidase [Rhodococcus pyridinivorans]MCD5419797.1 M23 family metallopeptidase [Rhodococcus pyridinivorans]